MDKKSSDQVNESGRVARFSSDIVSQKSLQRRQYRGRSAETHLNVSSVVSGNVAERLSVSFDNRNFSKGSSKYSVASSIPDVRLGLGTRGTFKQVISKETHSPGPSNPTTSSEILEDSESSSAVESEKMFEVINEQETYSGKYQLKKTSEAIDLGVDLFPQVNRTQVVAPGLIERGTFSEDTFPPHLALSSSISYRSSILSEVKFPALKHSSVNRQTSLELSPSVPFHPSEEIKYNYRVAKLSKSEVDEREIGTITPCEIYNSKTSMTYFMKHLTNKVDYPGKKPIDFTANREGGKQQQKPIELNTKPEGPKKIDTKAKKKVQRKRSATKQKKEDVEKRYLRTEVIPEEDLEIKKYYRNFCTYLIFLTCLSVFALSMVSSNMYYFTSLTKKLFLDYPTFNYTSNVTIPFSRRDLLKRKSLRRSNNLGDFWVFAESVMTDMLHWDFYRDSLDPDTHIETSDRKMVYENQILGVPRMRQVRVRNDSCEIHPDMARFFKECYYYYTIFSEETRPIRGGMESSLTATAWVYTEASKLNTRFYFGEISIYGGGGYYIDLGKTKEETKTIIKELKANQWLGRPTRAVFVDFPIYNANVNFFCLCKLVMEFPPMGGMIARADFQTLKLIRYLRPYDFFVLGIEFIYISLCVYYTVRLIRAIAVDKHVFFLFFWNYIDMLILLLSYIYVILGVILYFSVASFLANLPKSNDKYTEFQPIKTLQVAFNYTIAFLIFFAWSKIYKFLNYNTIMLELKATLSKSFRDILGFIPMFLTLFFTFAILGFLFFGTEVKDYRTMGASMMALLQTFVGEFRYEQIQEANRIIGPLFYITFLFFIIFVSLNVFIAIINDAYAVVKSKYHYHQPKTGKYFKRAVLNFVGCCCCGLDKKIEKRPKIEKKAAFEIIRQNLRSVGFTDLEIKVFFSKYNINVNNALSEKIRRKIIDDLELKRINFSETAEQFRIRTLRRKVDHVIDRIEEIEASLKPVIDKVDIILHRKV